MDTKAKTGIGISLGIGCGCISMLIIFAALLIFAINAASNFRFEPVKINIDMPVDQKPIKVNPNRPDCPNNICPNCGAKIDE